MKHRRKISLSSVLLTMIFLLGYSPKARPEDTPKDLKAIKNALSNVQEFIGSWKGSGETKEGKSIDWKEGMSWGWKFKGNSAWMNVEFKDGKYLLQGDLKYIPSKKKYQLIVLDKEKKEMIFEGEFKKRRLTLTRIDSNTKDKQIITMSTNNEGARLIYDYAVQSKGKGLEQTLYRISYNKEGVSLASNKKNECIVTGGLGTIAVSFGGKTYYVCCSGCRDAFNENPKKYIDEYLKKK